MRSQFLRESKIFCKLLEKSNDLDPDLQDEMLDQTRHNLKSLLELINQIEKQEPGTAN